MTDGLLLLHAPGPIDARMWEPQLAALSGGLTVAAPNLPGFGGSEPAGDVMTMGAGRRAGARGDGSEASTARSSAACRWAGTWRSRCGGAPATACSGSCWPTPRAVADSPEAAAGRRALAERLRSDGNVLIAEPPALLSDRAPEELRTRVRGWIAEQPPEAIAAAVLGMAERPDSTPTSRRSTCRPSC